MPRKLRAQARLYSEAASREPSPHLKKLLASHSMALLQLAERIERERAEPQRQKGVGGRR